MGDIINGIVVGAGALALTAFGGGLGYGLGLPQKTKNEIGMPVTTPNTSIKRASQGAGAALIVIGAVSLGILTGVRLFAHVPGRDVARTLNILRHITVQGGLFVTSVVVGVVGATAHKAEAISTKQVQIAGGVTAAILGSGLLHGMIRYGAKPACTVAGRIFAKWGLAPAFGAGVGVALVNLLD